MKQTLRAAAAALACMSVSVVHSAELEVLHWWTSGGETNAARVLRQAFSETENIWIDRAVNDGETARAETLARVYIGNPPDVAQFNAGFQYDELIEAGVLLDLTQLAEREGWAEFIQPADLLTQSCMRDGKVWCVPINIHSVQWAWASVPVFQAAGVPIPRDIPSFLRDAKIIQDAGFMPLAMSREPAFFSSLFSVVLLAELGSKGYYQIFRDRNPATIQSAEVARVIAEYRALVALRDEGAKTRFWPEATQLVIHDKAALQIMGDWARGEFSAAGEVGGVDYECLAGALSDEPHLEISSDVFVFFKQPDPTVEKAQLQLASLMLQPDVQVRFNLAKGSIPVRADIDFSLADSCMRKGRSLMNVPEAIILPPGRFLPAESVLALDALWVDFINDPAMSSIQAQIAFADILARAD